MIAADGLRHAVFEDCELAHAGENGLWLDSGCCDNVDPPLPHPRSGRQRGLHRTAAVPGHAGDAASSGTCWTTTGSTTARTSSAAARACGSASRRYNQVTHNEISDFHHLGISVGHSWGYAPSTAHHNLIAFNHVHHICNGYFSDGGGIYTLGISPGTVIRNNIVHDVIPTPLMPAGRHPASTTTKARPASWPRTTSSTTWASPITSTTARRTSRATTSSPLHWRAP